MNNRQDRGQVLAMLKLKQTATGPIVSVIGDWLVNRAKRLPPRRTALHWFEKTNVPLRYNIVSYHHPAQLCWEWFLSVSFAWRDTRWRKPSQWFRPLRHGRASFTIPFLFEIAFTTQNYGWMLSSSSEDALWAYALADAMLTERQKQETNDEDR